MSLGIGMWLTFCCLHSLQALRLPPRRLPVTGGVLSISPDSGLLCMNSTPGGRGSLGVRKSPWGIKDGPLGAKRFRYSKSIEIGLTRYKNPVKRKFCSVVRICRKSEKSADEENREEEKHDQTRRSERCRILPEAALVPQALRKYRQPPWQHH